MDRLKILTPRGTKYSKTSLSSEEKSRSSSKLFSEVKMRALATQTFPAFSAPAAGLSADMPLKRQLHCRVHIHLTDYPEPTLKRTFRRSSRTTGCKNGLPAVTPLSITHTTGASAGGLVTGPIASTLKSSSTRLNVCNSGLASNQ